MRITEMQEILPSICCLHFPSFLYIKFNQSNISLHNHVFGHLHCASLIIFRSHTGTTSTTLLDREQKKSCWILRKWIEYRKNKIPEIPCNFFNSQYFFLSIILIKYFLYIIKIFHNGIFTSVGKFLIILIEEH